MNLLKKLLSRICGKSKLSKMMFLLTYKTDNPDLLIRIYNELKYVIGSPKLTVRLIRDKIKDEKTQDPKLWQLYADAQYYNGNQIDSSAASFVSVSCKKQNNEHINVLHLVNANYPGISALVDDDKQLIYIPIPKCGSSTVKNLFSFCIHGETQAEFIHFHYTDLYRIIDFSEILTKYKNYYKFTIVRDPIERLVSYYFKNIVSTKSLQLEGCGKSVSNKLKVIPSAYEFEKLFFEYRRVFRDFRHHTDPQYLYTGTDLGYFDKIYTMSEISEIRLLLSNYYKKDLDIKDSMKSLQNTDKEATYNELNRLRSFYTQDYKLFDQYF